MALSLTSLLAAAPVADLTGDGGGDIDASLATYAAGDVRCAAVRQSHAGTVRGRSSAATTPRVAPAAAALLAQVSTG